MGQFKPMVKMMTTEPSVILKLKKGGKVAKADGGFVPMQSTMPAGMPARGGSAPAASPMKPSMSARRRAMNPNFAKGGKVEHDDAAQDRAMIKKAMAGKKFADGGNVTASMAKTTVKGNAGKFAKTKVVDGDKHDSAKGTGNVKNGNAGGFATGGTITGNVGKFAKTKVVDGDKTDTAKSTGNVKMGNKGGYAKGGNVNWENRPADTSKAGVTGTTTGGVRNGNAGGFKKGGSTKKAYATGGNVVDDGRAVAMPKKSLSQPVANSLQSGTFKKGGKVKKYSDGDSVKVDPTPSNSSDMRDMSGGAYDKWKQGEKADNVATRNAILGAPRRAYNAVKSMLSSTPTSKKRGGSAKC
jgi:hypothetical protein